MTDFRYNATTHELLELMYNKSPIRSGHLAVLLFPESSTWERPKGGVSMQIMVDRLLRRYRTEGFVLSNTAYTTPDTEWCLAPAGIQQLDKLSKDLQTGMVLLQERVRKARAQQAAFVNCAECGNEFELPRRHPEQKFCGGSCAAKASARKFWARAQPLAACQVDTPITDKENQ